LNSEGLLLLTNDGDLARHLEHPKTGWTRRYRVRGRGRPDPDRLSELAKGARIEGERFGPIQVAVRETASGETRPRANLWFDVALSEGKNREVRRALAWAGVDVNRLIRVGYGPFQLGDLDVGEVDKLRPRVLIDQLGKAWSERVKESGAERRAGPLRERPGGKAHPPRRQDEAGHAHRRRRS
jgi:23S rRNA pseudouridine2605 synthase